MADWGPVTNHEQVGIEPYVIGDPNSGSVVVGVRFYVSSVAWGFNDPQSLSIGGTPFGGSFGYTLSTPSNSTIPFLIADQQWGVATAFGGGPTYTFSAAVSGHYLGAGPSHAISFTVPGRTAGVPGKPPTQIGNITDHSVRVYIPAPAADNGAPVVEYTTAVWRQSDGGVVAQAGGTDNIFGGLTRAGAYYAAGAARNAAGWGPWSDSLYFLTLPLPPDAPTITSISNISTVGGKVNYNPPGDDGGAAITSYSFRYTKDATLATGWSAAQPNGTFTGLDSGATYYAQMWAKNSAGAGPVSNVVSFSTLSGVQVRVAGTWRDATLYVKVAGAWRTVSQLYKKHSGAWTV